MRSKDAVVQIESEPELEEVRVVFIASRLHNEQLKRSRSLSVSLMETLLCSSKSNCAFQSRDVPGSEIHGRHLPSPSSHRKLHFSSVRHAVLVR